LLTGRSRNCTIFLARESKMTFPEVHMSPALRLLALSSLLTVAAAFALVSAAAAQSRIGVTSASSGGPLGKPPAGRERVLHVGVDVQANELVTTGAADRAHLLFLDGSSLTVGPNARLTIDRFVYDPSRKSGELAINASQGVLRFVGGKISKTKPVTVTTPSATLTIRGGIMLVSVEATQTTATFMYGIEMTVTANGKIESVSRPGWQVVAMSGQAPGQPKAVPPGSLATEFSQLEALQAQSGPNPEEAMASSGFAGANSGLGTIGPGGLASDANNAAQNVLSQAGAQAQKPFLPEVTKPPTQVPGTQGGGNNFTGGGQ
jgi:hypothetical protein